MFDRISLLFSNICLMTDSYKASHFKQYPKNAERGYGYLESRGGAFDLLVPFGFQLIIMQHLCGPVVTMRKINEAERLVNKHMPPGSFNRAGWEHILRVHGGRLPIRIKAVPEGSLIRPHNVMITIENTDPAVPWLPNYLETLLVQAWYPTTVASQSRAMKQVLHAALELSGDPSLIDFKLHDFGFRGVTCVEQAGIGGAAHLVNFKGTDTLPGIEVVECFYTKHADGVDDMIDDDSTIGAMVARENRFEDGFGELAGASNPNLYDRDGRPVDHEGNPRFDGVERFGDDFEMPGFSIPASEHSTITSWGREHEVDAMRNMLEQYPSGLVACVSDSFNIWEACDKLWGVELRDMIEARDGTLVIRPDSGDACVVLPRLLEILGNRFGFTTNAKGYKVLNPKVRLIQGDGVEYETLAKMLAAITGAGWSADNVAFGSGGGLLQKVNRDTSKYAFKCAAIQRDGEWQDVFKDPITDHGKRSKRGHMKLVRSAASGEYITLTESDPGYADATDELRTVFLDGELLIHDDFATIRARAALT